MWLARHKNVRFHYTPTSSSWLNQIEIWFSILQGRSLHGTSFTSVKQLTGADRCRVHSFDPGRRKRVWAARRFHLVGLARHQPAPPGSWPYPAVGCGTSKKPRSCSVSGGGSEAYQHCVELPGNSPLPRIRSRRDGRGACEPKCSLPSSTSLPSSPARS